MILFYQYEHVTVLITCNKTVLKLAFLVSVTHVDQVPANIEAESQLPSPIPAL
jgi:hypothetical protein